MKNNMNKRVHEWGVSTERRLIDLTGASFTCLRRVPMLSSTSGWKVSHTLRAWTVRREQFNGKLTHLYSYHHLCSADESDSSLMQDWLGPCN